MDKQNDIQAILDLLSDYANKYDIDSKKYKDAYNSILALTSANTPTTTTTKQKTTKKTTKKAQSTDKKDIYDLWNGIIKNGMSEV